MSMAPIDKKAWHDFAHTLRVVTAAALARHDLLRGQVGSPRFVKRFEVMLLAAAAESVALPKSDVIALGGGLAVAFEEREEGLWVKLQLKGFAALQANANRQARLVSANGAIDYAFCFGGTGGAVCVLANVPDVRLGLASLTVLVEAPVEEP
jgi:hypothetical protein